jgi:RNA polymerase sigma-32 factor
MSKEEQDKTRTRNSEKETGEEEEEAGTEPEFEEAAELGEDISAGSEETQVQIKGNLPIPQPDNHPTARDALNQYLQEINRFPTLDPDEEVELARRVRENNDQNAAFRLVTSHLRLVVKIAMEFQKKWMKNVLELIQEGNVGLMKAVQKFNPERGIKFSYYAAFWIKAYILKFIMDNWRMVKIGTTQSQRKLFYNLSKERQRLENLGFAPDETTLSQNLDVSKEEIVEMSQRMGQHDLSLDIPFSEDSATTRLDMLPALEASIEDQLAQQEISRSLKTHIQEILPQLNEKERDILTNRLIADSPVTLREIGDKYNITRERVRQIETRLLNKLKQHLSQSVQDFSQDWIRHE